MNTIESKWEDFKRLETTSSELHECMKLAFYYGALEYMKLRDEILEQDEIIEANGIADIGMSAEDGWEKEVDMFELKWEEFKHGMVREAMPIILRKGMERAFFGGALGYMRLIHEIMEQPVIDQDSRIAELVAVSDELYMFANKTLDFAVKVMAQKGSPDNH